MNTWKFVHNFSLQDCIHILIHKAGILLLTAVLSMAGFWGLHHIVAVSEYGSTAVLYVLKQQETGGQRKRNQEFALSFMLIEDCKYLLQSHAVLDQVIDDQNLPYSYKELLQRLSIGNPENSRILEVTVTAGSPDEAQSIVNAVCNIGSQRIAYAMGSEQTEIVEYGMLNPVPINRIRKKALLLFGLSVTFLTYVMMLLLDYMNDRIRSEEDIRLYLHLPLLGDIPEKTELQQKHYCKSKHLYNLGKKIP